MDPRQSRILDLHACAARQHDGHRSLLPVVRWRHTRCHWFYGMLRSLHGKRLFPWLRESVRKFSFSEEMLSQLMRNVADTRFLLLLLSLLMAMCAVRENILCLLTPEPVACVCVRVFKVMCSGKIVGRGWKEGSIPHIVRILTISTKYTCKNAEIRKVKYYLITCSLLVGVVLTTLLC